MCIVVIEKPRYNLGFSVCIFSFVYSMFNYLIPLNMEAVYGADGAAMFGTMTSVNAIIVIVYHFYIVLSELLFTEH